MSHVLGLCMWFIHRGTNDFSPLEVSYSFRLNHMVIFMGGGFVVAWSHTGLIALDHCAELEVTLLFP